MRKTLVGIGALVLAPLMLSGCTAPAHPWAPQHQPIRGQAGATQAPPAAVQAAPAQLTPAADRQQLLRYELKAVCNGV